MSVRLRSALSSALVTSAILLPSAAQAACDLRISRPPQEAVLLYDPFELRQTPAVIELAIENRGDEECQFDLAITDRTDTPVRQFEISDAPLVMEFRSSDGGAAGLLPTPTPGIWRGSVPPGDVREFTLDAAVTIDAVPLAGRHDRLFEMELREPGAAAAHDAASPFAVVVESRPRSQMNIAGAAGHFGEGPSVSSVDMGVLRDGSTKRVFLQVRSNVETSRLQISSENAGFLMPEGRDVPPEAAGVPYHLVLDDVLVDLREPSERQIAAPRSVSGASLPMDIVIDDATAKMGGRYSDVISFEISPL